MNWLSSIPVIYRWAITLFFTAIVIVLSITPSVEQVDDSVFSWLVINSGTLLQKTMHVAIYALVTALWVWSLERMASRPLRFALAAIITIGLGAALEWYQLQVPGRFGTLFDVALNTLGAALGLTTAAQFQDPPPPP